MHKFLFVFTIFFSGAVSAATIDFESPVGDLGFTIDGVIYEGIYGPDVNGPVVFIGDNGTNVYGGGIQTLGQDGFGAAVYVTLERIDGEAFSLHSVDFLANANGYDSIIGTTTSGGSVTLSTALGTGDWLDITRVDFSAVGDGFSFSFASMEIDNIIVGAAVPVPAAVWLFGSALVSLGWMRRKLAV